MTTQMSDLEGVLKRLEKLEKQNRRLKRAGGVFLALAGVALLMGSQAQPKNKTVEAEKFVLQGGKGKTRAEWFISKVDDPNLVFYDDDGKIRVELGMGKEGPNLVLKEKNGKERVVLLASEEGSGLFIWDKTGNGRVTLSEEKKGTALYIADENKNAAVSLGMSKDGSGFGIRDEKLNWRVTLSLEKNQVNFKLLDENGKSVFTKP